MKWKVAFFTIPEYVQEQDWLRFQHKKGWKLTDTVSPCFYKFEKCESEDVVYQLDYNQEGLSHKEEYVQMFGDCGWEHITDMMGYSYFRKPLLLMQEEEEIFSDDASKLDMAERVFKGRIIPLLIIFFLLIIPQLLILEGKLQLSNFESLLFGIYIGLFAVYVSVFVKYTLQYVKLKKKIGE